jgi:sulfotransferase 6B1
VAREAWFCIRRREFMVRSSRLLVIAAAITLGDKGLTARVIPIDNFFVVTVPKSGTHLIAKCMTLLTNKNALRIPKPERVVNAPLPAYGKRRFLRCHLPYSLEAQQVLERHNFKSFLMIRDPRDQVISMCFWLVTRPYAHPDKAARYAADPKYFFQLLTERIKNIKRYYDRFTPWIKHPRFYTVKFERLVGKEGSGSKRKQLQEISNIARHINLNLSDARANYCVKHLFGDTITFRKGQIGSWKKYFKPEHKRLFKEVAGQLLIDLGYEKDFNW